MIRPSRRHTAARRGPGRSRLRGGVATQAPDQRTFAAVLLAALLALGNQVSVTAQAAPPPPAPVVAAPAPPSSAAPAATAPPYRSAPIPALTMESAALLLSGQEGGSLPLRVAALPVGAAAGGLRIAVWVELDSDMVASADGAGRHLELAVYAVAAGEVRASRLQEFRIPPGPVPETMRLVIELIMAPGSYSLRVLARDRHTAEVGLRVLAVEIPGAGSSGMFPPLLATAGDPEPWTLRSEPAGTAATAEVSARAAPASLTRADGAQTLLLPVWRPGEIPTIDLQVRRPGDASGRSIQFQASPSASAGAPDGIGDTAASRAAALSFYRAELPVAELAAGPYEIAPAGGAPLLRLQVSDTRTRPARAAAASARPPASRRRAAAAAVQSYRQALEALAADPASAAPAAAVLAGFEPQALASGSLNPDELLAIEIGVADSLSRVAADALLPVIALHLELYASRRRTGDPGATTHAREMAIALARLYAERGGDPTTAGEALLGLASLLDETSPALLRRTLIEAAEVDPGARTAWRGLAIAAERGGDFQRADFYLRRLMDAEPDSPEAHLRLGIHATRARQPKAALRHLSAASRAANASTGLRLVAAQETARAYFESGEPARAAAAARAGLALDPADEKLLLLLASALDAQGRRAEAAELLAGVVPSREPNPRWALTRHPSAALEAHGASFHQRARAALPGLARALAAVQP